MAKSAKKVLIKVIVWFISMYQLLLSPWFGRACRFNPSCSEYTQQAIIQHGIVKGSYLSMMRIVKCHPWGGSGEDPVPPAIRK